MSDYTFNIGHLRSVIHHTPACLTGWPVRAARPERQLRAEAFCRTQRTVSFSHALRVSEKS